MFVTGNDGIGVRGERATEHLIVIPAARRRAANCLRPITSANSATSAKLLQNVIRFARAALISCRGGPPQSSPETMVFVSATTRAETPPPLSPRGVDLGLDFVFAHRWKIECGEPGHRLAQARGGGIPRFLFAGAQKINEILDFGNALGWQRLQFLNQPLRIESVHQMSRIRPDNGDFIAELRTQPEIEP